MSDDHWDSWSKESMLSSARRGRGVYPDTPPAVIEALRVAMMRARHGLGMEDARLDEEMHMACRDSGQFWNDQCLERNATKDIATVSKQRPFRCGRCGLRHSDPVEAAGCCPDSGGGYGARLVDRDHLKLTAGERDRVLMLYRRGLNPLELADVAGIPHKVTHIRSVCWDERERLMAVHGIETAADWKVWHERQRMLHRKKGVKREEFTA